MKLTEIETILSLLFEFGFGFLTSSRSNECVMTSSHFLIQACCSFSLFLTNSGISRVVVMK